MFGHAIRYLINPIPKPGIDLIRSRTNTFRTELFVGQGIRWTKGGGGWEGHGQC